MVVTFLNTFFSRYLPGEVGNNIIISQNIRLSGRESNPELRR